MSSKSFLPTSTDLTTWCRGFLMGAADIIPGVSGGTVALILGIYNRLITAISNFDTESLDLLWQRNWPKLIERLDLRFLIGLGLGIGSGILFLAGLMHHLLLDYPMHTYAAFFGLILASSWLVALSVSQWNIKRYLLMLIAVAVMSIVVSSQQVEAPPPGLWYIFCCGAVAICAMILPGISGAFILLLLGKYSEITGLVKAIPKLQVGFDELVIVAVFCLGCLVGLLSFCRLLKRLLANHEQTTLAVLCGVMIGSLLKLWPFKLDLTPNEPELKYKLYQNLPLSEVGSTDLLVAIMIGTIALVGVLILDWCSRGHQQVTNQLDQVAPPEEKS